MTRKIRGLWMVLVFGALLSAGCANKEAVKSDEGVAPAAATTAATPEQATAAAAAQPEVKPAAESVPAAPQVQPDQSAPQAAPESALSLETVYFDFDKAVLKPEALTALEKNFSALKEKGDTKIRIEGNCDERGSDEYNLALGDRRARSAKDFLIKRGIEAERLETVSYGKERPADQGHDEDAWSKNRRADFVIVK